MKIRCFLFCFVLLAMVPTHAQVIPFEPTLLPANESFGLTISPDGRELFFVRAYGGRDKLQIFHSRKVNGQWQSPVLAPFADTNFRQIDPAFSPDGQWLLFNSLSAPASGFDVFRSRKTADGWSAAEQLPEAVNSAGSDFYATISKQQDIYFTRRTGSNDLYVSRFTSKGYAPAELLDTILNTAGNESNPYISPKADFLIFFADYPGGLGDTDLYISFQKNNKWSKPIHLGPEINGKLGEFCPSIDYHHQRFTFSRTEVVGGKRMDNVYSYPLQQLGIQKLRKLARWPGK